jgi:hypothetical protein
VSFGRKWRVCDGGGGAGRDVGEKKNNIGFNYLIDIPNPYARLGLNHATGRRGGPVGSAQFVPVALGPIITQDNGP